MIRLLHYRSQSSLVYWVHLDSAQLLPAWKAGLLPVKFCLGHISLCDGEYGTYKESDHVAVKREDACTVPRGLLILEAQCRLFEFLRDVTRAILGDSVLGSGNATTDTTSKATQNDVGLSNRWLHFLDAERKQVTSISSFGATFVESPFSDRLGCDLDTLIDIAQNISSECQDELWLLQTDLEYFYERVTYYDDHWFDSLTELQHAKIGVSSEKDKYDNIAHMMTLSVLARARDSQMLLEDCLFVKKAGHECGVGFHTGSVLTRGYKWPLGRLCRSLTVEINSAQYEIGKLTGKSGAFRQHFEYTYDEKAKGFDRNVRGGAAAYCSLYEKDRLTFYLLHLMNNSEQTLFWELPKTLQDLDEFLNSKHEELPWIDPELYRVISRLSAIQRMQSVLSQHRPRARIYDICSEKRSFCERADAQSSKLAKEQYSGNLACIMMGLGSNVAPISRFKMPKGKKNEAWLVKRDDAQKALSDLWRRAREEYEKPFVQIATPKEYYEPDLTAMRQSESHEHLAQLEKEREEILDRLQTTRKGKLPESQETLEEGIRKLSLPTESEKASSAHQPQKDKVKTRPAGPVAARYAAAFANLNEEETEAQEKVVSPTLYTVDSNSIDSSVLSTMFPESGQGVESGAKTFDWMDFVQTMSTLNFSAQHRDGSAFTFTGNIYLPDAPTKLQKRSINVHRPHPRSEMGPILLRSLGRILNKRFGWERANFLFVEKEARASAE